MNPGLPSGLACISFGIPIAENWRAVEKTAQRINAMNEKSIDQIEEEVLSYEVSDEAVEEAGTTEIAGAWTFVCTGIECNHSAALNTNPHRTLRGRRGGTEAGEVDPVARHGAQGSTRRTMRADATTRSASPVAFAISARSHPPFPIAMSARLFCRAALLRA
jgi:hypothetical protein